MTGKRAISASVAVTLVSAAQLFGVQTSAQTSQVEFEDVPSFRLAAAEQPQVQATEVKVEESERDANGPADNEWDIWAPVRMRSANPQDTGTIQLLNTFDYSTAGDGTDDDSLYRFELQYGIAPNHEVSIAVPVLLGDGSAEGNANLEVGWHWRLWDEKDLLPAFALRNELFIPSGYHASGVDWKLTGLVTKSLTPRWRIHANPFIVVASGDSAQPSDQKNPGDLRHFRCGVVSGTDYAITDNFSVMADLITETSEYTGNDMQHAMEAGAMWEITDRHGLGVATRWTLDGDDVGANWGASLTYSYTFKMPAVSR